MDELFQMVCQKNHFNFAGDSYISYLLQNTTAYLPQYSITLPILLNLREVSFTSMNNKRGNVCVKKYCGAFT
jgi:hypothetical protein